MPSNQLPDHQPETAWIVAPSPLDGRGVFAARDLAADEVVHTAPVLLMSDDDHQRLLDTAIDGYVYEWYEGGVAFALGVGSLINHDDDPNCRYELADENDPAWPAMTYLARRAIEAGEELTVDYLGGEGELWFDPA